MIIVEIIEQKVITPYRQVDDFSTYPYIYATLLSSDQILSLNNETGKYEIKTLSIVGHTHSEYALTTHTHLQYALTSHTHLQYALTSHTHSEYALTSHTHSEYALTSHTHSEYALTSHTHSEYALTSHTHSEYALTIHTHSEYAASDHTHTGYAASNHTHSEYALTIHTHSEYALTSHAHSWSSITSTPTTIAGYGITNAYTKTEINTEIYSLKLADVRQQDSIQQIENVLNINQGGVETVSGYGSITLPSNASNKGMGVILKGLTSTNLVNGKSIVSGGSVTFSTISGHKYYVSNKTSLITGTGNNYTSTNTSGSTIDIIVVDLTATFGSGNEPVFESCGNIYPTYFASTKHFEAQGRIRSVNSSNLKPSYLYLNSLPLRSNGTVRDEISFGVNGYELIQRISRVDNSVLGTPVITPISYGGLLNSNANGHVYREKVIYDSGIYGSNIAIQLTGYPISSFDKIIKRSNGVETVLSNASAVISGDKLSFTHPSLSSGDIVIFTYYYTNESVEGETTVIYDSFVSGTYLPLSGGTLTGKLTGTEAEFTTKVKTPTLEVSTSIILNNRTLTIRTL